MIRKPGKLQTAQINMENTEKHHSLNMTPSLGNTMTRLFHAPRGPVATSTPAHDRRKSHRKLTFSGGSCDDACSSWNTSESTAKAEFPQVLPETIKPSTTVGKRKAQTDKSWDLTDSPLGIEDKVHRRSLKPVVRTGKKLDFTKSDTSAGNATGLLKSRKDVDKGPEAPSFIETLLMSPIIQDGKGRRRQVVITNEDSGLGKSIDESTPAYLSSISKEENDSQASACGESSDDQQQDSTSAQLVPSAVSSKHPDLQAVSAETLSQLLKSPPEHIELSVIDCRYPYEYSGGHIKTAINFFTEKQIRDVLFPEPPSLPKVGPNSLVLVCHCEFSAERAPNIMRFIRNEDRKQNFANYPLLNYPNLYLLEGGYKEFYSKFPSLCMPSQYVPMLDKSFKSELLFYKRIKSKKTKSCT